MQNADRTRHHACSNVWNILLVMTIMVVSTCTVYLISSHWYRAVSELPVDQVTSLSFAKHDLQNQFLVFGCVLRHIYAPKVVPLKACFTYHGLFTVKIMVANFACPHYLLCFGVEDRLQQHPRITRKITTNQAHVNNTQLSQVSVLACIPLYLLQLAGLPKYHLWLVYPQTIREWL
jgi:hypothetical protein